jgi:hypothetical protein
MINEQSPGFFSFGPVGRPLNVDASGRLVSTVEPIGGLYVYGYGDTGRFLSVDASGSMAMILHGSREHGEMHLDVPIIISANPVGTFFPVSGFMILDHFKDFSSPASGQMRYDGQFSNYRFKCSAVMSVSTNLANRDIKVGFAKNGTVQEKDTMLRTLASPGDLGSVSLISMVDLDPGDIIDIRVAADNLTADFTFNSLVFNCTKV